MKHNLSNPIIYIYDSLFLADTILDLKWVEENGTEHAGNAYISNYSAIKGGTVDCSGFCRCMTAEAVTKNRTAHQLNSVCRVHHMKLLVTPRFSSFCLIFLVLKLLHSCLKFAFSVAGKHRIVQMSCVDQCNGGVCLWLCRQDISQCNGGVYLWARHFAVLSGV